jgi:NAD(P)H-dependent flavin oxidoreductase YrpB (nitropropane dioxygenase family)
LPLNTEFTELVGCQLPIQLAPMSGITTPELVAAVVDAGGMGAIGAGPMPPEALAATLDAVRARTRGPIAVNILVPLLDLDVVDVAAAGATIVDFYHGPPDAELVERVHRQRALAGWQVGSLDHAEAAAAAGCDVLVVRGVEGGGRMHGSESLWPLLFDVVESVDVPVLAAGGIGDARGLAAALAAGAGGVRMGTRFLAAIESAAHPVYRDAVIAASASDSVLTDEFREGWPDAQSSSRVLVSSLEAARTFEGDVVGELSMGPVTMPVPRLGVPPPLVGSTGAVAAMPMYAGESVRFVHAAEPAGDIVRDIAAGAERLLSVWR